MGTSVIDKNFRQIDQFSTTFTMSHYQIKLAIILQIRGVEFNSKMNQFFFYHRNCTMGEQKWTKKKWKRHEGDEEESRRRSNDNSVSAIDIIDWHHQSAVNITNSTVPLQNGRGRTSLKFGWGLKPLKMLYLYNIRKNITELWKFSKVSQSWVGPRYHNDYKKCNSMHVPKNDPKK